MQDVIIIGGGLAGLVNAVLLARKNLNVLVIEKKQYPFHRVCGEYISRETVPFLKTNGLYPDQFDPPQINKLLLTSTNGKSATLPLDSGGFGISRHTFDQHLYQLAISAGAKFLFRTVQDIRFADDHFTVTLDKGTTKLGKVVIGAYGKRAKLDKTLNRTFINKRSPYIGVKYHIKTTHPDNLIALHNFEGGYCGISNIEDGKSNLCYLSTRENLKRYGNIQEMEKAILFQNPFLKQIFSTSAFLFEKPEVINEISFAAKKPIENHILMTGDTAGMITPLCGNGMAMAIHAAKISATLVHQFFNDPAFGRSELERVYITEWQQLFSTRLWTGRKIQSLFGSKWLSNLAVNLANNSKPAARFLVSKTHGKPF